MVDKQVSAVVTTYVNKGTSHDTWSGNCGDTKVHVHVVDVVNSNYAGNGADAGCCCAANVKNSDAAGVTATAMLISNVESDNLQSTLNFRKGVT